LELTRGTLKQIIDAAPMPCILRDSEYGYLYSNQNAANLFALNEPQEFKEIFDKLSPPYQPDGSPSKNKFAALLRLVLEEGKSISCDWLYSRKDRKLMPTEITLLRVEVGEKQYIMEFLQDVTESLQMRAAERVTKQRLQTMMDFCPVTCGLLDKHFNVLEVNNEVTKLFNLSNKQTFTDRFFELSPEYQPDGQLSRSKALDKLQQTFEAGRIHYEWLHQSIYGEQIPCEVTLIRVRLGDEDMAIIYIKDLREIKGSIEMMEKMQSKAYTDELTQLFNRRYFIENATAAIEVCKANKEPFHIIMCDIDHFKGVNDTYGHPIGDEVLKITAKRMSNVTRKSSIIARFGGEEFIIMITGIDYEAAVKNAQRIQKAMEESSVVIKGMSLNITISLGVATVETPEESLDCVIHKADVALYAAKKTGRNKVMEYSHAKELNILK
jgi:diguanylate cyclase (GGDEF)-like protein